MKFKLCLLPGVDAAIVAHAMEKNATKLAQIVASLIPGTQRKMDKLLFTAWFVSLAFLILSCKIANIHRKPASDTAPTVSESVRSLRPTQFERVKNLPGS